ncbi:protein of unknown function (plasmid) [Shinella sp. WSC3-e]|nr:protein of unknown function [Shinella sp. WSC3-e]
MQDEDQDVDLPDLGDEGQAEGDGGAYEVECDQQRPPWKHFREGARDRCDADIGDHLDGECRTQHRAGVRSGDLVGEQAEGDRRQTCPDQRDDLRQKEVAIGSVLEDAEHAVSDRSEIFGDRLELGHGASLVGGQGADHILEAMVEMVLDQRALGIGDRLFDGMKLLCEIEAGAPVLDHRDDALQMSLGPLQPLDDLGMGLVPVLAHMHNLSPWIGYCNCGHGVTFVIAPRLQPALHRAFIGQIVLPRKRAGTCSSLRAHRPIRSSPASRSRT